ncbi:MAG: AAA family ATPase [Clostridioides sp.]|jgi:DNA polymerase III delta prime subunit|nr:AAA family ATPase [Clostridioides sp.]
MNRYKYIDSELEALKLKEQEKKFYNNINKNCSSDNSFKIIPKVTPFKGINTDFLYIKEGAIVFVKLVDTPEELFSILEEELMEVMFEEYTLLCKKMKAHHQDIKFNYVFIMPYVDIESDSNFKDFIKDNIIDKNKFEQILENNFNLDEYLKEKNDEVLLNLFIMNVCAEYYVINDDAKKGDFKKITFFDDNHKYTSSMMEEEQITWIDSIKYGKHLINGASGTGKSTMLLSRAIKLSKIYPHHKFLILTQSKKSCNQLIQLLDILYVENIENCNIEINTVSGFVFKLAKKYGLIVNYNKLKYEYIKVFDNIVKQADNIIKNKHIYKGIFIDEAENLRREDLKFISKFLYKTKHIFNVFRCDNLNISQSVNAFKKADTTFDYDSIMTIDKNYRHSKNICNYINNFCDISNNFLKGLNSNIKEDYFEKSTSMRSSEGSVEIIKVSDIDDQISSIIWEIENLVKNSGMKYEDILVIYPYSKKKMKNGSTLYFQYSLSKNFESASIPYIYADENLTNLNVKNGVTISNIYSLKSLEYKVVIFCELELFYNHVIANKEHEYIINDFVGDLNKINLAISRAKDYLKIIIAFDKNASDLIKIVSDALK